MLRIEPRFRHTHPLPYERELRKYPGQQRLREGQIGRCTCPCTSTRTMRSRQQPTPVQRSLARTRSSSAGRRRARRGLTIVAGRRLSRSRRSTRGESKATTEQPTPCPGRRESGEYRAAFIPGVSSAAAAAETGATRARPGRSATESLRTARGHTRRRWRPVSGKLRCHGVAKRRMARSGGEGEN